MDGWLSRVMYDRCMMEWRGACMNRPMQGMDECMGWMEGCMHGWMDCVEGRMDP